MSKYIPEDVKLVLDETARHNDDCRTYRVYQNGEQIGVVESQREPSYRKSGRHICGYAGNPKSWGSAPGNYRPRYYTKDTRREAIQNLIRDVEELNAAKRR